MTIEEIRQTVQSGATPIITCEAAQILIDEIDRLNAELDVHESCDRLEQLKIEQAGFGRDEIV